MVVEWIAEVFNMVWREGVAPGDWKNAVIVPVYKKGSRLHRLHELQGNQPKEYC